MKLDGIILVKLILQKNEGDFVKFQNFNVKNLMPEPWNFGGHRKLYTKSQMTKKNKTYFINFVKK